MLGVSSAYIMRRARLRFAGLELEFVDREAALRGVEELAERGTYPVYVVFGPEGCGKTAWLKQSAMLLKELGFDVLYINPVERELLAEVGVEDVKRGLLEILREVTDAAWVKASWALIDVAKMLLKVGRKRLAILADDVFQAIGLNKANIYVKGLLGLIEYPPSSYERIVAVVATGEGVSRREIGRHRWATLRPMWNMSKEGFRELYDKIPGDKPPFEDVWRITGGNPGLLAELYKRNWDVDKLISELIRRKNIKTIVEVLTEEEKKLLARAINYPDVLVYREGIPLANKLVELNLIVDNMYDRDPYFWVDVPPPEKDLELGIGKEIAWQTPIYREAVKKVLQKYV